MVCSNKQIHEIPFEEYLKLPGYSYSGIRNEGQEFSAPTPKMQLGTKVHDYLLTPEVYDYSNIEIVRPLAIAVKQAIGPLFKYLKPEVAVTADFYSQGFKMPYKGRIDLGIPKRIIVDLKISEMNIAQGIKHFGYDRQTNGYAIAYEAPLIVIVSIHPKTKKTTITNIPIDTSWWEYQIIQRGEPLL